VTTPTRGTLGPSQCTVCSQIPVGSACQVIDSGETCEAETVDHECIEKGGRLVFECPDMQSSSSSSSSSSFAQNVSLGGVWNSAQLSIWSVPPTVGQQPRPAKIRTLSGGFGVKCRICGLAVNVLKDRDVRAGQLDVLVEFGPNVLGGVVTEHNIAGYGIYFVDGCHNRNNTMLSFVPKAEVVPWPRGMEGFRVQKACDCPRASYSARVTGQFPRNPARIMVAPVTNGGYALPVGVFSEILIDHSVSPTDAPQTAASNYAEVTGSFDLALNSLAAAVSFARDPKAVSAVARSLASMAGAESRNVKVSLSALGQGSNEEAMNPSSQGVRRLQSVGGLVRASYGISFAQQDGTGLASTVSRYPQAFAFARVLQDSGASVMLATLVVAQLQALSGGVNIYGPMWVEKLGPLKIEEVVAEVSTSTPAVLPLKKPSGMDPTMQIVVATSGATGLVLALAVTMALTFWCCRTRRRDSNMYYEHEQAPGRKGCCCCRASGRGQHGYRDKAYDLPFAHPDEFSYPGGSEQRMAGEPNNNRTRRMVAGQEVMVYSRSQGTWVLGHVRAVGADGSIRVRYMNGKSGHEKVVAADKVATSLRQAYHRGQAVRVFSEEQRRWVDGTITVVQMDESLVIQAEGPGAPQRIVIPRNLLKTNVRRLQYNSNTNSYTDNHFTNRRGHSGDFIAM